MGNHSKRVDVPSQVGVPHQVKFPSETAANQGWETTARPRTNASSGFPGEFPLPKPRTIGEMAGGEFYYESHTKGRKTE
jgi:hypothetical protein